MSFLNQPHRAFRWGPSDRRTPYSLRGSSCDRRIILPDKFARSWVDFSLLRSALPRSCKPGARTFRKVWVSLNREWEFQLPRRNQSVMSGPAKSGRVSGETSGDGLHWTNWAQGDSTPCSHFHIKSHPAHRSHDKLRYRARVER